MKHHSAYPAGRQAYFAGREIDTNPWIYTDTEASAEMHAKWQAGWFDAQEERKQPMTAAEASQNVAEMFRHSPVAARRRLLQIALGPLGNLSEAARAIYADALKNNR